jgi:RNA polymerase sigma-70 factor (ECF subfamily)
MRLVSDQSFEAFFREEYRKLVALGAAMTGGVEIGQDLAQDALARAYQHWAKIGQYDRAGAWVRRVVINLAIDTNRRRGSERAALSRLPSEPLLFPVDATSDEWWRAVRALPDRQRAVVTLYYLEDMSVADVAAVLDIAEGTVKATLSRARSTLSATLREVDAS